MMVEIYLEVQARSFFVLWYRDHREVELGMWVDGNCIGKLGVMREWHKTELKDPRSKLNDADEFDEVVVTAGKPNEKIWRTISGE